MIRKCGKQKKITQRAEGCNLKTLPANILRKETGQILGGNLLRRPRTQCQRALQTRWQEFVRAKASECLQGSAKTQHDHAAAYAVVKGHQGPSGKAFQCHDSTSEGEWVPLRNLRGRIRRLLPASPRPEREQSLLISYPAFHYGFHCGTRNAGSYCIANWYSGSGGQLRVKGGAWQNGPQPPGIEACKLLHIRHLIRFTKY